MIFISYTKKNSFTFIYCHPDRRGRDRMVVRFTTTCAISVYHHESCKFESSLWWGVLNTTLFDKVCQWLAPGWWFFPGTRGFSPLIKLTVKIWLKYCCGVKHYNPNPSLYLIIGLSICYIYSWLLKQKVYNFFFNHMFF